MLLTHMVDSIVPALHLCFQRKIQFREINEPELYEI